jgi:hypothetical protein
MLRARINKRSEGANESIDILPFFASFLVRVRKAGGLRS